MLSYSRALAFVFCCLCLCRSNVCCGYGSSVNGSVEAAAAVAFMLVENHYYPTTLMAAGEITKTIVE
jgi:hypothetical protein